MARGKKDNDMAKTDKAMSADVSAIDEALAAAKARVDAKRDAGEATPAVDKAADTEAKKAARELERATAKAARDAARAEKKAGQELEREAKRQARAAKKLEKETMKAAKAPAHMSKVEKAAAKLPILEVSATNLFNKVTQMSIDQIGAFAEHLQHFVRVQSTKNALGQKLVVGQVVRIVSGVSRFIGQTATVTRAQRIRCYVSLPGSTKEIYLFTSDVAPLDPASVEELPAEQENEEANTGTNG